jgi:hypothetical protein
VQHLPKHNTSARTFSKFGNGGFAAATQTQCVQLCHIGDKQPLDAEKAVKRPEVQVLPPMPLALPLQRSEASNKPLIDIGVDALNVGVRVMNIVFDAPQCRTHSEQI